jgi:succinoglycan biosynthesis protein ExoA
VRIYQPGRAIVTETCFSRSVFAPDAEPHTDLAPFISVIVPVRNEALFIEKTLRQLLDQDYDRARFEVLVADGQSTDGTQDLVRGLAAEHPQVRLLANSKRWSSAGRNVAVRAARGALIVVVDGHCDLNNPGYLRNLADAFARSGADCVGRPQPLDISQATPLQRAIAAARASRLGHNPASYIYSSLECFVRPQSVAVAYRREVFEKIGLFDEAFDACEDVEFNHRLERAGMTCYFTPRVGVRYHPRNSLAGLFRQMVRYGRGRVRLLRKHPESLSLPCLLPALFLLGLLLGPVVAKLSPLLAGVYFGALSIYGSSILLSSFALSVRGRDLAALPWLPFVFAAVHAGAGVGVLLEFLMGKKPEPMPQPAYAVQALRVVAYQPEAGEENRSEMDDSPLTLPLAPRNLAKGA